MIRTLTWTTIAGVASLLLGYAALRSAYHFYPDSNLLGGWALVLGPLYWLGWLCSAVGVIGWILAAIVGVTRKVQELR